MFTILALFILSFGVTLAVTPLLRNVAIRRGWVDLPDGRKIHKSPIPRVGGVALFLAYVATFGLFAATTPMAGGFGAEALFLAWRLLPATAVMFATGLLDDRFGLSPLKKLTGQLGAAVLACLAGVRISGVAWQTVDPWLGVPLTLLWLVACTNAFNLIDGLDGLAAGIGLFATLTTFVAALLHGDLALAVATAPLAGALCGFLRYNFNPATIFLGDSGSLFVGFLLGCYSVIWWQKCATILGMTAPLMALAVPICDAAVAVVRRFVRSKPIFTADRAHIHHRLLDLGLSPRGVVVLLYLVSGAAACRALIQTSAPNEARALVLLVFCVCGWFAIRRLGYEEFRAVAQLVRFEIVRGLLSEQLQLRSLESSLAGAATAAECWDAVRESARELGFNSIALRLGGNEYLESFRSPSYGQWSVRVPLAGEDYIHLTREFHSKHTGLALGRFVDSIHGVLGRYGLRMRTEHVSATAAASGGPSYEN